VRIQSVLKATTSYDLERPLRTIAKNMHSGHTYT